MKDTTEVKVGDVIRIVKSENVNMHYFPKFTLCKVVKFSPEDEYDFSYEVISLYKMNLYGEYRYLTQYILREDFEVYMFSIGDYYELQNGDTIQVLGRSDKYKGYETLICSDGKYRYDRSTSTTDSGRCTGTGPGYSCEFNIKRKFNEHDADIYRRLSVYEPHDLFYLD